MHLFYQPEPVLYLTDDELRHAVRTLRLGVGDAIAVTDGHGNRYSAVITKADARRCEFRIMETVHVPPRPFSVRIAVAPTKNMDRIEWLVEKAVEVGVERISFFVGDHSERRVLKLERIEKIAVAALKQSLQSRLPRLDEAVPFAQLLATLDESERYVAHLPDGVPETPPNLAKVARPGKRYVVLIGPEGDFSPGEMERALAADFRMVTLGPNRLRTETAALTAVQVLNFINA